MVADIWDVILCSLLEVYQHFRGSCHLCQGGGMSHSIRQQSSVTVVTDSKSQQGNCNFRCTERDNL
jgi:hypothetical protein